VKVELPKKLRKKFVARRKRAVMQLSSATKQVSSGMKTGAKKLEKAEKSGALEKWRKRVSIGVQAIEVATVAMALVKGRKLAKRRAPAKKTRRAT
jgi:hypothetical protein